MPKLNKGLSNAQRAKIEASQSARSQGRPRKEGDRYPCGKLKPDTGPNLRVVELRQLMLGNDKATGYKLAAAENPLDLAVARGWLTEAHRDTINAYRTLYTIAGPSWAASVLKFKVADLNRSGGGALAINSPATIARYALTGSPRARDDLRSVWAQLRPYAARQEALNAVALRSEWPAWMITALRLVTSDGDPAEPVLFGHRFWLDVAAKCVVGRGRRDLVSACNVVRGVLGMDGRTHPFGEPLAA